MSPPAITRFAMARIEILIVSPGGSGTTILIESLAAHAACSDPGDRDALKHFPSPLVPLNSR